ncbi:hypothetical protein NMY22_g6263 [Coprinellus aureogranulatus]|nr:hypothetical protein NMY22_g6263 [Coprinellus aureogranulatus]
MPFYVYARTAPASYTRSRSRLLPFALALTQPIDGLEQVTPPAVLNPIPAAPVELRSSFVAVLYDLKVSAARKVGSWSTYLSATNALSKATYSTLADQEDEELLGGNVAWCDGKRTRHVRRPRIPRLSQIAEIARKPDRTPAAASMLIASRPNPPLVFNRCPSITHLLHLRSPTGNVSFLINTKRTCIFSATTFEATIQKVRYAQVHPM